MRELIERSRRHVVVLAVLAPTFLAAGIAAAGTVTAGTVTAGTAAAPATARPGYRASTVRDFLTGVAASSAKDAWASAAGPLATTLHWKGSGWMSVPGPAPGHGASGNALDGVAVTSAGDAWAVGSSIGGGPDGSPAALILHWNGRAWTRLRPRGLPAHGGLYAVSATSVRNAWAVGYRGMVGDASTLIVRWNGRTWRRVPSPDPVAGGDNELEAVAATSSTDAWAVGYTTISYPYKTAILHWDGTAWSRVPSPNPTPKSVNILFGIAATSADRIWAVGDTGLKPMILRWDGTDWAQVRAPCPAGDCQLFAVTARSARTTWAVGENGHRPLILRWNGAAWEPVPIP